MKKILLLPLVAFAVMFAWAVVIAVPAEAWVCGDPGVDPHHCITPTPGEQTSTPIVVTATATPTKRPTKTPTEQATQTPVIIIVTATPTLGHETRSACAVGNTICGPNTGSGGYLRH